MTSVTNRLLKRFASEKRGTVAILGGIALAVVFTSMGGAIDYSRYLQARATAQGALDSAALAAATELSRGQASMDEVELMALNNFKGNIDGLNFEGGSGDDSSLVIGDGESSDGVTALGEQEATIANIQNFEVDVDQATSQLITSVDVEVPTLFSNLIGIDAFSTTISSITIFGNSDIEISFVLDVTGSMGNQGRLNALKVAMTNSLNSLFPEESVTGNRVRAAIVPYAYSVNLGGYHLAAVGADSPSASSANTCVMEREAVSERFTETVPDENQPATLYETDVIMRPFSSGACPAVTVRPLTDNREALQADVDSFIAQGYTGGHMGIDWGINMLIEEFGDFWGDDAAPGPHDDANVRKILVVMTDGAFNTAFYDDPNVTTFQEARSRRDRSESAALSFCNLAKEERLNIEVFSVAFRAGNRAENLLRNCASEDTALRPGPHYFDANSNAQLVEIFDQIISQTLEVRLTN
ncbi:MAG: pilus assembly protein TadG-related protein [Pseudomonadota bacterium]